MLAAPIESDVASRIEFLDVSVPAHPKPLRAGVDRPASRYGGQGRTNKAGAVATTKLDDERVLVAVWADSDEQLERGQPTSRKVYPHLDLYLSNGNSIASGFPTAPVKPRKWDYHGERSVEA